MRKRQRISNFYYFLFFAQFFGPIQQQQTSQQISRHFFVPARQQAAQQLRSRAANPPPNANRFETITMPGGQQFVLVPRRLFQRPKFSRPSRPHFGLLKTRNSNSNPHSNSNSPPPIHEKNVNLRSRQVHPQQRRGAIVPHLRSLSPKQSTVPQAKQLPQIQSTSQKRIPLIQPKSSPNPEKLRIPPKASIPSKMVPSLLPPIDPAANNVSRALEIKRRQEQFMKAQQRELKQIKERLEKERQKLGKSRPKIVEKNGKSDELTKKERERELMAIQRQQKLEGFEREIMRQIFRERTFSIATPPVPLQQPQTAQTTTPKTNGKMANGSSTTALIMNSHLQQNEATVLISSTIRPPPTLAPLPPPTPLRTSTPPAPQIAPVTQTASPNAAAPSPPVPISTSAPDGAIQGASPPAAAAPPGQMPPSDNVVAELNNANDFMEVAHRLRLRELFARRRLATSALAAVV